MTQQFIVNPLFVPATRLAWIDKAAKVSPDAVIIDLEDAVSVDLKDGARRSLQQYLEVNRNKKVIVRVNSTESVHFNEDILLCAKFDQVEAVLLPKAESEQDIELASESLKPIWALIESARGLINLQKISSHMNTDRLVLGTLDLSADLGAKTASSEEGVVHDNARYEIIKNSVAFGLSPALDGVCPNLKDTEAQKKHAIRAKNFGFGGVLCIHPTQVPIVRECFNFSDSEIEWAKSVKAALKGSTGATSLNGEMIDAPVVRQAERILASLIK